MVVRWVWDGEQVVSALVLEEEEVDGVQRDALGAWWVQGALHDEQGAAAWQSLGLEEGGL